MDEATTYDVGLGDQVLLCDQVCEVNVSRVLRAHFSNRSSVTTSQPWREHSMVLAVVIVCYASCGCCTKDGASATCMAEMNRRRYP